MNKNKLINTLGNALQMAYDHLEYYGYGDSWERECAIEEKLPEMIKSALELFEKFEEDNDE